MANIKTFTDTIKSAPRGEDVRDAIIGAIRALASDNDTNIDAVSLGGYSSNDYVEKECDCFDDQPTDKSFNAVYSSGLYNEFSKIEARVDSLNGEEKEYLVPVSSISLISGDEIEAGDSTDLYVYIDPPNAYNKAISLTTSNDLVDLEIMDVPKYSGYDGHAVIRGNIFGGDSVITVSALDGSNVYKSKIIHVNGGVMVSSITITASSTSVTETYTIKLNASINPSDALYKDIIWSSSDTSKATVDSTGLVTAISAGNVVITASSTDGSGVVGTYELTVRPKVYVTSISISGQSSMYEGYTVQLSATINPSNADNKDITWTSSNTNLATVNSNGLVTAKRNISSSDYVTITCTSKDEHHISGTYRIYVEKVIYVTSIEITGSLEYLAKGYSTQLTATVYPSNATFKNIVWGLDSTGSTSNNLISISANGSTCTVTAKTNNGYTGGTRIYAYSSDLNKVNSVYELQIIDPITDLAVIRSDNAIYPDHDSGFAYPYYDQERSTASNIALEGCLFRVSINKDIPVDWSVSSSINRYVSKFGSDLLIIPTQVGQITIYATLKDGSNITASLSVNVKYTIHISELYYISAGKTYQLTARRYYTREQLTVNWKVLYDYNYGMGEEYDSSRLATISNGSFKCPSNGANVAYINATLKTSDSNCLNTHVNSQPTSSYDTDFVWTYPSDPFQDTYHGWFVTAILSDSDSNYNAVDLTSFSFDDQSVNVSIGSYKALSWTIQPQSKLRFIDDSFIFRSSNYSVVMVSARGIVYGISSGSATITATHVLSGLTATCTVYVS